MTQFHFNTSPILTRPSLFTSQHHRHRSRVSRAHPTNTPPSEGAMSDYYMPPSSRDRERERDRDRDRGGGSTSQGFVKRESTWRPKSQPSRPANAWASRDSPRDSPGPSRKVDAYYEPLRADDRDKPSLTEKKDQERERDRDRDRDRSRSREPVRDSCDGYDRDRDRDVRESRDFRDQRQTGWRKREDERGTWDDYRRRRRSPARWGRDRDDQRDSDRDRDRDSRWARDRDDDRRDKREGRESDKRDADLRDRDEPRNRWARSPEPTRRSPSPRRKRNRSPALRRGANSRASPDYGLGRAGGSDSDSDEPRRCVHPCAFADNRRSPPRRSSPSPPSRRSPSLPPRRRSPSPPPRRRSPSPEKRRLESPSLPEPKRAREISPPRGRSPSPPRRARSPPLRERHRSPVRDRSLSRSRSLSPRRSPVRNGKGTRDRDDRNYGRRARSPDSPPRFNRGRWDGDRDRWKPQPARNRWGQDEPTKMRQWGRPASPSPSLPRGRSRSRSRSSVRSLEPVKERDRSQPPFRPARDSRDQDGLPYSASPERELRDGQGPASTGAGANGAHPVRTAMKEWKPAPTGPAAQRNGNVREKQLGGSPAPRPSETPQGDVSDVPEVDMDLDDEPPPPPQPKRSDKWSPVKRTSPKRNASSQPLPSSSVAAPSLSQPTAPASLQPSAPPARSAPTAFVPRASVPSGPASIASAPSSAPSRPASGPGTPRGSDTFLNRLADKQHQFDKHMSTIAPYISTAFGQWYAQNATPALHPFLIHHFGRQPSKLELDQIHQLLRMRTQLSRDQQELRHQHAQAVRGEGSAPPPTAPVGPRAIRERNQPPTGPAGARAMPSQAPVQPAERAKTLSSSRPRAVAGEAYERLAQVGEGTYGKVYKARNTGSGALVALKRIRMEQERDGFPVTSMREIKLLQALDHPNIVKLMEMMVSNSELGSGCSANSQTRCTWFLSI